MSSEISEIGPGMLRGLHILIVDDNADARAIYKSMLEYVGASVLVVSSATAAARALRHVRPDVVITDLSMPRRDGMWLIRWIRARDAKRGGRLPVMAVTARDDIYSQATSGQAGFDSYLTKPVAPRDLCATVERLTRQPVASEHLA